MRIAYVGLKASRTDTVAGTGIVWDGAGDVQDVPDDAAAKLLKHPDVWAVAGKGAEALADAKTGTADPEAPGDGLDAMTKEALHEMAKERGVEVHHAAGKAKVIDALRAAAK